MTTDNVSITSGVGTSISADYVGGVHVQRVKVQHGADGYARQTCPAMIPYPSRPHRALLM